MDNCMFTLMLKMLAHMILLKPSQTWIVPFFFFLNVCRKTNVSGDIHLVFLVTFWCMFPNTFKMFNQYILLLLLHLCIYLKSTYDMTN